MKLYVWDRVVALKQYSDGFAFAFANSEKEAVDVILKAFFYSEDIGVYELLEHLPTIIKRDYTEYSDMLVEPLDVNFVMENMPEVVEDFWELREMKKVKDELERTRPHVFRKPIGFFIYGSE